MSSQPIRILLAETETGHVEAIRRALQAANPPMELRVVGSLRDYRQAVAAHAPDLAVLDLFLPDGRAETALTSPPEAGDFPILLLSSPGDESIAEAALTAGALDHLVKSPESFAALPYRIRRTLREWDVRRDITSQKGNEAALRQSELKYRTLAETLREACQTSNDIVERIPSGLFIYQYVPPDRLFLKQANPEAERLTGIRIDQWRDREFNEIWPNARQGGVTDKYLEAVHTGKMYETEDLWYQDDRLSGAFRIRPFSLPENRLAVAFENITNRKQAEASLRRSLDEKTALLHEICEREARYRAVVETSPDGFWMTDLQGRLLEVNDAYVRRSGYRREELLAMCVSDVEASETPAHIETVLREGSDIFQTQHRAKDGTVFNSVPGE